MGTDESGYDVRPGVLTADDVSGVVAAFEDLGGRSRAGARHLMAHPVVAGLATDHRLLALAEGVLGIGARPYRATLFDKSPRSNWLVVWHQDTALPLRLRRDVPGWGPWSVKCGSFTHTLPRPHFNRSSPFGCIWTTPGRRTGRFESFRART